MHRTGTMMWLVVGGRSSCCWEGFQAFSFRGKDNLRRFQASSCEGQTAAWARVFSNFSAPS